MFVFPSLLNHFGVVFFVYNFGQGQNLTLCKKAKVLKKLLKIIFSSYTIPNFEPEENISKKGHYSVGLPLLLWLD